MYLKPKTTLSFSVTVAYKYLIYNEIVTFTQTKLS